MNLLMAYSYKNIFARKLTSTLTIAGVALVAFVFCAVLMLTNGLKQTLVDTGNDDNVTVIRRASKTEIQSIMPLSMGKIIISDQAFARSETGEPMVATEIMVLISQPKRGYSEKETSNVPVRGVSKMSFDVRSNIKIKEGRMFTPGTSEVIAGTKAAKGFQGCQIGGTVRFASRDWTIVGIFDGGGSGFDNELWGDYDQLSAAFERPIYSSLTGRLKSHDLYDDLKKRLNADPRLIIDVDREKDYYAKQSSFTTTYISILGTVISIIFSLGAIVGAMITMYATVADRTKEIGTLRALGFSRFSLLITFLVEAVMMSVIGGLLGIGIAYFLRFYEVSTTNWDTFAEIAFSFEISPGIIIGTLIFSIVMGFVGGFLPAARASRLKILTALRAKAR